MGKQEIYDFLSATAVAANYTGEVLRLAEGRTIMESGGFTGATHVFDDASEQRVAFSTRAQFLISCPLVAQPSSDAGIAMSMYFHTSKAHGVYKSFPFAHEDGHRYTVRFNNEFSREMLTEPSSYHRVADIVLKVLGRGTAT